jgi:hypothetical protein
MIKPPSITISVPVIKEELSEPGKAANRVISSACAKSFQQDLIAEYFAEPGDLFGIEARFDDCYFWV